MRKSLFFLLLTFFFAQGIYAQCESCNPPKGRIVDYCYQETGMDGFCAMFSENLKSFHFENANRKKNKVVEVYLPKEFSAQAPIQYLVNLTLNKKLKLNTEELLFIAHAVENWHQAEAIRLWKPEIVMEGYTMTETGMAYKVLKMGNGEIPTTGQMPKVHYTGYLLDGKKFDSSRDRKAPFEFALGRGQVIKGWDLGVAMMPVGSRFVFMIPADLAYGSREIPNVIPSNSTLIFDVELLSAK